MQRSVIPPKSATKFQTSMSKKKEDEPEKVEERPADSTPVSTSARKAPAVNRRLKLRTTAPAKRDIPAAGERGGARSS